MKIGITGASGLVGSQLSEALRKKGHEIIPLVRKKSAKGLYWNYKLKEIDSDGLSQLDGLIHLAGEHIASGRWTARLKDEIYSSRAEGTAFLTENIQKLKHKPQFFLSASAIGYYGDQGETRLTETHAPGNSFLAQVCKAWEKASEPLSKDLRLCWARIGVILSCEGGALKSMLPAFRMGVAGPLGSGKQYFPWIDIEDVVRAFVFLVEREDLSGAFNFTAPEPVTNEHFTKTLARQLKRPAFLRVPKAALKLVAGEMADELLLSSLRVIPQALQSAGFEFKYASLDESLKNQLQRRG